MDGFTGSKTAAPEELPDAVTVMDPFHVVRLAGDALVPLWLREHADDHMCVLLDPDGPSKAGVSGVTSG